MCSEQHTLQKKNKKIKQIGSGILKMWTAKYSGPILDHLVYCLVTEADVC